MKDWSNELSASLKTDSASVKTATSSPVMNTSSSLPSSATTLRQRDLSCITRVDSLPASLASGDSSKSLIKTTSSPTSLASGEAVKLTGGSSGIASASRTLTGKAGALKAATAGALVTPLAAGTTVGAVAAVFYGVSNMLKYAKNKKSGKQALKDTTKGSVGLGISATLGFAAANAVAGTALAFGSIVIVPTAAGVGAAVATIKIWNRLFFKEKGPARTKKSPAKTK